MLTLLTVLPLLPFILIDTHVKGRLLTNGFFFSLAYTTNYVVLTQLTLRFLKLISLLYILYNTFNIYLHWVRQWQSMRGRLHHIIDTMQIFHFKNGCTLSKWPIQPELIPAFQPRIDLEYCCCPWIGWQSILGYYSPLPPRFLWQFAGTHVYSSRAQLLKEWITLSSE